MRSLGAILVVGLLLCGCTRTIDDVRPQRARPVAPIAAAQVEDLLTPGIDFEDHDLFASVEPGECAAVAQEAHAPFVFDPKPVAQSSGYRYDDDEPNANIIEIAGVYHSDFNPGATLDAARHVVDSCEAKMLTLTAQDGTTENFRVQSRRDSGSSQIVIWSLADPAGWACDNALVAAHNAAIEVTACSKTNGYDVLAQAQSALNRIEALANMTH